ncbi:T9SS type A sorting domain-containing protein [Rhodocaloribacter sp.]
MKTVSIHPSERANPLGRAGLSLLFFLLFSGPGLAQELRWEPLERPMRSVAVLSLAAAPDGALYVGAGGEGALYRRAPGAETWTRIPFPQPSIDAVMPVSPDTVFVNAADTGGGEYRGALFRSIDGGATWERMTPSNPHVTAIVRTSGDALLALDFLDRFLRSDDGGKTWREASPELPFKVPVNLLRLPDGRLLTGAVHGVWISDDGATWTPTGLTDPLVTTATVAPDGVWYAGTSREGLWRSTDEGATWTRIAFEGRSIYALTITPEGAVAAGVDDAVFRSGDGGTTWTRAVFPSPVTPALQGLLSAPDGTLYAGMAEGLFRSDDDGRTWTPDGPEEPAEADLVAALPEGGLLTGSNARGWFRSPDDGRTWLPLAAAPPIRELLRHIDGSLYAASDAGLLRWNEGSASWDTLRAGLPERPVTALAGAPDGALFVATDSSGVFRLPPGAKTGTALGLEAAAVTMLAVGDAGRVLAASATALYRSTDGGDHWSQTDRPEMRTLRALFATPAGEVFARTEAAGLWRSTDFGRTWRETRFPDASAEAATLTGTPLGDVFAGTNHGVFRSTDGGATWRPAGLDTLAIRALTLDAGSRLVALGEGPSFFRTAAPVFTPGAPSSEGVALEQNYPNPASGTTTFTFTLPERAAVSLDVYDVLGRRVARLLSGTYAPGLHRLSWDPSKLAAGLYVYRLEALGRVETRRMVILPAR